MFRGLRRRTGPSRTFLASLRVHQLNAIPSSNSLNYVRWEVVRASLADPPLGRTAARPVESGNVVQWNQDFSFEVRIPSTPDDPSELQPCVLRLCIRSERRRNKGFDQHGIVELDLADLAGVGRVTRTCLVHQSLLNCTLKVTLRLELHDGDHIFRRPGRATDKTIPAAVTAAVPPVATAPSTVSSSGSIVPPVSSIAQGEIRGGDVPVGQGLPESPRSDTSGTRRIRRSPSEGEGLRASARFLDFEGDAQQGDSEANLPLLHASSSLPMFNSARDLAALGEVVARERSMGPHPLGGMEELNLGSTRPGMASSSNSIQERSLAAVPSFTENDTPGLSTKREYADRAASTNEPDPAHPRASALDRAQSVPLSPRSPSISIPAATILDYLVPEEAQEEVYELIRSQQVRDSLPQHITQSRVPVASALNEVFETARRMLVDGSNE